MLDRSARLLCVAAHMALTGTGLQQQEGGEGDPNLGLVCGTMFGSVHSITSFDWSGVTDGPAYVNPMEFPNTVINSPAGQAAIKHKLRGVNSTISAGLVSGLYAIHYAAEFLRFGRATALLAGGVEELCEESFLSFRKVGVISGVAARSRSVPIAMEPCSARGPPYGCSKPPTAPRRAARRRCSRSADSAQRTMRTKSTHIACEPQAPNPRSIRRWLRRRSVRMKSAAW